MENETPMFKIYRDYHERFSFDKGHLKGRLLTLVDAAFSDPEQRKAFKDLLSQEVDRNFIEGAREHLIYLFKAVTKGTKDEMFQDYGMPSDPQSIKKKSK